MSTVIPYFKEAMTFTDARLTPAIIKASIARQVWPFDFTAKIEDSRYEYFTEIQDFNNKYSMEQTETPESTIVLQKDTDTIPIIHGSIAWHRHELKRINRSQMSAESRISRWAESFALDEDRIALATSDPITGKTGVINTTNHSTATSTELNVTTIALCHSTLTAQVIELMNSPSETPAGIRYRPNTDPLHLILTIDVYNKAASVLSTVNEELTGLDMLQSVLTKHGGPGSAIFKSADLGATVTKAATDGGSTDRYNQTDGTTNSLLKVWNPDYSKIIASPLEILPNTAREGGLKRVISERMVLNTKEIKAARYGGTAVIA
jgi:hypothetical protein